MSIINNVLRTPSYGWKDQNGNFYKPTSKELFKEFFSRLNIFKSRKNWLAFTCWSSVIILLPFVYIFVAHYFSFALLIAGFVYGMMFMGTHGTIWYHRYSTHHAYTFKNGFWKFITRNLGPKMIPEEIYVISHHVHHAKSDTAGDPYNANGGWLYCFLADANHQPIAQDLSEEDYNKTRFFLQHTGIYCNSYKQYQKWGTVSNPYWTIASIILNLTFWYTVFYFLGGHAFATALFGGACFWAIGVRTFNFDGHGRGTDKQKEGVDFNAGDKSINQYWPGIVAGEWHNNHHLFPRSARAGFLKYQIDFAWYYIYLLYKIGAVKEYFNSKDKFMKEYYEPYVASVKK
jgi:stearoyl-CoA desaturase (delta-9 desaturase)